jgi:hypothetical protein
VLPCHLSLGDTTCPCLPGGGTLKLTPPGQRYPKSLLEKTLQAHGEVAPSFELEICRHGTGHEDALCRGSLYKKRPDCHQGDLVRYSGSLCKVDQAGAGWARGPEATVTLLPLSVLWNTAHISSFRNRKKLGRTTVASQESSVL